MMRIVLPGCTQCPHEIVAAVDFAGIEYARAIVHGREILRRGRNAAPDDNFDNLAKVIPSMEIHHTRLCEAKDILESLLRVEIEGGSKTTGDRPV